MIRRQANDYLIDYQARTGRMCYLHFREGQFADAYLAVAKWYLQGLLLPSDVAQLSGAIQDAEALEEFTRPPRKAKGVIEKFIDLLCGGK